MDSSCLRVFVLEVRNSSEPLPHHSCPTLVTQGDTEFTSRTGPAARGEGTGIRYRSTSRPEEIQMKSRWTAGLMALAVTVGLLFAGAPVAQASSKGRLNTTYALGAATIFSLVKGKTIPGLI